MTKRNWGQLSSEEFKVLDREATIAVLPVAAIEQHGPHLPVSTDATIAEGMIGEVIKRAPDDLSMLFLPVQAIGKSNEHLRSPGTLTLSAETAMRSWIEIGESIGRAGLRKLIIVNSHGGNAEIVGIVARELRVRCDMLVVSCAWSRFGRPPGLYSEQETSIGIHAGEIETSLMLYFAPESVRLEKAKNFSSAASEMAQRFRLLRPTGFTAFGWIAQDLNPEGALGDASQATAEKGRATAQFAAEAFVNLAQDVKEFELGRLA